jgi:hypothetical protein
MDTKEYLDFHTQKEVRIMFKHFLGLLEDLKEQHDISFTKLFESLPDDKKNQIVQADYLDERAFEYLRKKTLDAGNECARAIQTEIAKFDINFKNNK